MADAVCPFCGAAMSNGSCPSCGYTTASTTGTFSTAKMYPMMPQPPGGNVPPNMMQ